MMLNNFDMRSLMARQQINDALGVQPQPTPAAPPRFQASPGQPIPQMGQQPGVMPPRPVQAGQQPNLATILAMLQQRQPAPQAATGSQPNLAAIMSMLQQRRQLAPQAANPLAALAALAARHPQ
jgi:hypothetical protein